ncbi:MAG: rfaE bifunctional protein [Betaproteobacteria bacterium]|nr:rfaE bifunctional protein [Betaproteobacteria bacterium]
MKRAAAKPRVLVVGDVMLDRYWFGDVGRISPEAPVPVVKVDRVEERPGGAANVARNAVALGAAVSLLSVVGRDEAGVTLRRLLKRDGVTALLQTDAGLPTTIKLRVIARQQQLVRVDFETPPSHEALASKLREFQRLLRGTDAVILSDYGKGGLTHIVNMIRMAREAGKPVLVDPKGDDYSRYRGATLITPNRSEFREVAGSWKSEGDLTRRANALMRKLKARALLVTRSEEGMTLYQPGRRLHVAAQAREVFDVSGAGDTVIATLGVMLARGASLEEAVRVANRAAGIVVGKFGTAVVQPEELFAEG